MESSEDRSATPPAAAPASQADLSATGSSATGSLAVSPAAGRPAPADSGQHVLPGNLLPDEVILREEPRNLLMLCLHHIVLRTAWVFKTESVIMPAFLDSIAGAGWIRGLLPVFNRIGQSGPPLLFADTLRRQPVKSRSLLLTSVSMGFPFLLLSGLLAWPGSAGEWWLPAAFLLLYFLFFCTTGMNQLAFSTVQGRLIRPHRRGRLMGLAGVVGSVVSITCAWYLLGLWLDRPDGGFVPIFLFCGCGFVIAGLCILFVREPADSGVPRTKSLHRDLLPDAWRLVRNDRDFRRLAIVSMLFVTGQLLFPHYQALGRGSGQIGRAQLMHWVVAQNASVGVLSLLTGAIADRSGNRLAVRLACFGSAITPPVALLLAGPTGPTGGHPLFWLAFLPLGFMPVTFRTLTNYVLELAEPHEHPRYVSTLKLCMAVPFLLSPLVGLCVDLLGFVPVFLAISALMALGGLLTFRLSEPRHAHVVHSTVTEPARD
ncbi:MAG: MFS transporter [Planctomycetaceae bacterium]|nr:MFS transporter [Planctomycetaceae bacterium]